MSKATKLNSVVISKELYNPKPELMVINLVVDSEIKPQVGVKIVNTWPTLSDMEDMSHDSRFILVVTDKAECTEDIFVHLDHCTAYSDAVHQRTGTQVPMARIVNGEVVTFNLENYHKRVANARRHNYLEDNVKITERLRIAYAVHTYLILTGDRSAIQFLRSDYCETDIANILALVTDNSLLTESAKTDIKTMLNAIHDERDYIRNDRPFRQARRFR